MQLEAIGRAQDATARQQRRAARLLWSVAILVLVMLGFLTWQSDDLARREINVFTARATEALNDEKFDRAMRYALQVYPAHGRLPFLTPFSTELEGKLAGSALSTRLHRVLKGHTDSVSSAAFSGDGKRVVTASKDNTARIWDVTWATLVRGDTLRERVCAEKLIGAAQEFTDAELEDPILRGIDKDNPIAQSMLTPGAAVSRLLDPPSGTALAFDAQTRRRELNQLVEKHRA